MTVVGQVAVILSLVLLPTSVSGQRPRVTPKEDRRIAPEGPGYALSRISAIATLPNRRVAVLSAGERTVRVFDDAGRLVQSLGRDGGGPGEFRAPTALGVIGDSVWVGDAGLARITVFHLDGRVVRTAAVPAGGKPYLLATGHAVVLSSRPFGGSRNPRSDTITVTQVSGTRRGALVRIFAPYRTLAVAAERGTLVGPQPFDDDPIVVVAPDGTGAVVVERPLANVAATAHFRVIRIGPGGETRFVRRIAYSPRPLSPDQVTVAINRFLSSLAPSRSVEAAARRALFVPKFLPPATNAVIGRTGEIWVRREDASHLPWQGWLVLARDGRVSQEVDLGSDFQLLEANESTLWGVRTSEDGTMIPVRLVRGSNTEPPPG